MRRRHSPRFLIAPVLGMMAALASLAACTGKAAEEGSTSEAVVAKQKLGLFTTLPIYWGEDSDIQTMLDGAGQPDWVRSELETRFEIVPLDTLEPEALEGLERVFLAQPRPLAPSENVAFDRYLADGGLALIMADPMLTRHSDFAIGDRRRPQDVVLLSPIFARLGVELLFEDDQPEGERSVTQSGESFPVNLPGRFEARDSGSEERRCFVIDDGLIAQCASGRGIAYLYGDAALLDWEGQGAVPQQRKDALWKLLEPLVPDTVR